MAGVETFVVRVWRPAQGETGAREPSLHGVIERAGDAHPRPFRDAEELLGALRAADGTTAQVREEDSRCKHESFDAEQ
jgi:hypothetical protein